MPIKFHCPYCKQALSVKDELGGKKGNCPSCKKIITVPAAGTPSNGPAAAPPKPGDPAVSPFPTEANLPPSPPAAKKAPAPASPPRPTPGRPAPPRSPAAPPAPPADIEAEAAALLSEGIGGGGGEVQTVDFKCPYCDQELHLKAVLAGKKTPCPNPECRRIIEVPKLFKTQRTDWRGVNVGGPSMAKRDAGPAPEGAWGSTSAQVVSRDALVEAQAVKGRFYPKTIIQKYLLPVALTLLVVGLGVGYWVYRGQSAQAREDQAVRQALEAINGPEVMPGAHAAIHQQVGEYHLRSGREKSGVRAREHFGKAQAALAGLPEDSSERNAALAELAALEVELGGAGEDVDLERRLKWDEVQKIIRATLAAMGSSEARREAVAEVTRRLIARGQADRVLPLINLVYSAVDADRAEAKAEAMAVAGLEFHVAGAAEQAEKAAEQALAPYATKPPPPLRAAVVALAMALGKQPPKPGPGADEKGEALAGQVEGLARQDKWVEARAAATTDKYGTGPQFRAQLGLASAAVDRKNSDAAQVVDRAVVFLLDKVGDPASVSWPAYRLARLALASGVPGERVQALAQRLPEVALRGRIQLEVFRFELTRGSVAEPDQAADAVGPGSVAGLLAQTTVARWNVRGNPEWAKAVADLPEPRRAFAAAGAALGLEDRRK